MPAKMPQCEFADKCPFFNDEMDDMPSMAKMFKDRYCNGIWASCARYMIRTQLGPDGMVPNLWPNQESKARDIIARSKPL